MSSAWKLYYDDMTSYGSEDGPWDAAPVEGVLAVVTSIGGRFDVHSGHDYYQLEEDGTVVARDASTILHAVGLVQMGTIKFGRYTSNTKMERVFARIRQEWQ